MGGYAVQLARAAGAHVIATGSPRSSARLRAAGADEVIDHTTTSVASAVAEPVDVLLDLAPLDPAEFAAHTALVRDGGVVVSTTVCAPADPDRGVRAVDVVVRSDAGQLSDLVARVDGGELTVDVGERVALADLGRVHAQAAASTPVGKVVVLPDAA